MEFVEDSYDERIYNTNVSRRVKQWLAKQFKTNEDNVSDMLITQNATVYLLVWPIMEQKAFKGFMRAPSISIKADDYEQYYGELNCDESVRYFFNRYQDPLLCDNLLDPQNEYKDKKKPDYMNCFMDILLKDFNEISNKEKLIIMFTTVYRYRNNIFHGNKKIDDWKLYSEQIELCTEFMMSFTDVYLSHNPQEHTE